MTFAQCSRWIRNVSGTRFGEYGGKINGNLTTSCQYDDALLVGGPLLLPSGDGEEFLTRMAVTTLQTELCSWAATGSLHSMRQLGEAGRVIYGGRTRELLKTYQKL